MFGTEDPKWGVATDWEILVEELKGNGINHTVHVEDGVPHVMGVPDNPTLRRLVQLFAETVFYDQPWPFN